LRYQMLNTVPVWGGLSSSVMVSGSTCSLAGRFSIAVVCSGSEMRCCEMLRKCAKRWRFGCNYTLFRFRYFFLFLFFPNFYIQALLHNIEDEAEANDSGNGCSLLPRSTFVETVSTRSRRC
jgi:hypothetical protein